MYRSMAEAKCANSPAVPHGAEEASAYSCAYLAGGREVKRRHVRGLWYWHCSAPTFFPKHGSWELGMNSILRALLLPEEGGGGGLAGDTHSGMLTSTILSSWVARLWGFPAHHFLQKCAETCFYDGTVVLGGFNKTYHKYPSFHFNLIWFMKLKATVTGTVPVCWYSANKE